MDVENILKKIEGMFDYSISHGNEGERAMQQRIGKIINHEETSLGTSSYENALSNIERIMKGERQPRWIGQNVKSGLEKAIEENNKWAMK